MPDYQMAAWLMAVFLNGMTADETVAMTSAMVSSGRVVDLSSIPGIKVDKHSTGGVADTTTLVLAPLVAACGVPVAKMSGRGLGHTGGTLDKLEAIPGFSVELSPEAFLAQVRAVGVAVIAQSPDVDPADKKIYALRDVTATVPSIPLIVGSIISKKVAGGADAILLDVKVGSGAFMKTETEARALAAELTRVGQALGREVVCVMSDMDQPLGMAVGNALEVREAILTLRGEGPEELTELCLALGSKMLVLGRVVSDEREGRLRCQAAFADGSALEAFRHWIAAQGGDARVADDLELVPLSAYVREVRATQAGYVASFDAEGIGRSAMLLGAGRATTEDAVDFGAGLQMAVRVGTEVSVGTLLCTMYASDSNLFTSAEERFCAAVHLSDSPTSPPPLFHEL
jgi:pyrimidine-nucleoside phosphorylase